MWMNSYRMTGKSHMTHVQVRLFFEYNSLMDEYNSSLLDDSSVEEIKKKFYQISSIDV